jgi:hypothetical protein
MAITSAIITVNNNDYMGYVEIESEKNTLSLPSGVSFMTIYRKKYNSTENLKKLFDIPILSVDDLTFSIVDITAKSGIKYQYTFDLGDGTIPVETENINVDSWFNGMFIGDEKTSYMAQMNYKNDYNKNTKVGYVNTLLGRTPYRVSNSALNYAKGSSSGIFCNLDANNHIVPDINQQFAKEVVDFLTNGEDKLLKTSDGGMWYVSIDESVDVAFFDYYDGRYEISFSWTEINDEYVDDVAGMSDIAKHNVTIQTMNIATVAQTEAYLGIA